MSHFYEIQTVTAKNASLKNLDGDEAQLLFLTMDDQRVNVILPRRALKDLARRILSELPDE